MLFLYHNFLDLLYRAVYYWHVMNDEQFRQHEAWLAALHEDNKKLRAQIKHMSDVIDAAAAHSLAIRADMEKTRYRVGALCLFFIIIPVIMTLAFCTMTAGAAAGQMVKDAQPVKRTR